MRADKSRAACDKNCIFGLSELAESSDVREWNRCQCQAARGCSAVQKLARKAFLPFVDDRRRREAKCHRLCGMGAKDVASTDIGAQTLPCVSHNHLGNSRGNRK